MNANVCAKLQCITLWLLLILITLMSGCATNTIYLHTYDIEQEDIEKIVTSLKEQNFEVEVSDRIPPMLILGSFIIYSRDSDDNGPLVKILDAIGEHGYHINLIAKNRVRNHYYTKKTNIGLYLINPLANLLTAQQQLEIDFAFNLTDVVFSSSSCTSLFSLEFKKDNTAIIRQTIPNSNDMETFQWLQAEDKISMNVDGKEINYLLEKNYTRSGNKTDLLLTLATGNALTLGINEPFACKYESLIHLID
jgi:hypothetical protein